MLRSVTSSSPKWDARLWGALVLLCGIVFLDGLDVSMVGVALPSIQADLGLSTSQLQWIVSAYVLGLGGLLLLGGRAADLLGRRRVLFAALAVFTVASLVGGLVDDPALLIAARFVKGAAAAFTVPAALSLITTTFTEGPGRNKALAIFNAFGASGFSFGLVFGGLLTSADWRLTFLLPVPIAAILLFLIPRYIAKDRPYLGAKRQYDLPGAVLLTVGMLVLVHALVEERVWEGLLAVVALAAFVMVERQTPQPLVRLGIFRSGSLVRANLGAMCLFGAYVGFQFAATLYLQGTLGWSALETALAFLPGGLFVAFGAPRMGAVISRFGTTKPILASTVAFAAGYALFLPVDASPVLGHAAPGDAADRPRLHARLRRAQRAGHGGRRRPRAGPRRRARADLVPDRRGGRAGRGQRGGEQRLPVRDRGRARRRGAQHRARARRRGAAEHGRGAGHRLDPAHRRGRRLGRWPR